MNIEEIRQHKIVLFDGVCNLCNNSVIFVFQHESTAAIKFASIQSETGKELLSRCGLPSDYSEAVVLLDRGKMYLGSTAALKIGQTLKFPWWMLATTAFIVPEFIRDWVYNQIGKHRYRWFGKRDFCMVPTENLKARFL